MKIGTGNIDKIFTALDRQIGVRGGEPINLVVCGGTALSALGLVNRTTKDVDVLAMIEENEKGIEIRALEKFPVGLEESARVIARDFILPDNWLNLGPAAQVASGLPDGLTGRLVKKNYGKHLNIYYIGRLDQIFFKLYAAADRNDYHVQDLAALNPTGEEIKAAVEWVLTQDVSEGFRMILKDFLNRNGYEDIAPGI